MNILRKAWHTTVDAYRLTRFRQKTENTAFGFARRHGIELRDAVWIRDNAPEDAWAIVAFMRRWGVDAKEAYRKYRIAHAGTVLWMRSAGCTSEQMSKALDNLKRRAIGDWDE